MSKDTDSGHKFCQKFRMPDTKRPPRVDDPEYWRFRAEEARTIADDMKHGPTKAIMLGIANDYDKIAQMTEDRLRGKPRS